LACHKEGSMEFFSNISNFFNEAKQELDKVIFPTKIQVKQAFIAVVMVVAVISIFLALVDLLMSTIVSSSIQ